METLLSKLEKQLHEKASHDAYSELASLRASYENLRLQKNRKIEVAGGGELTIDNAFRSLHDEFRRVITERLITNRTNAIVNKIVHGEKK